MYVQCHPCHLLYSYTKIVPNLFKFKLCLYSSFFFLSTDFLLQISTYLKMIKEKRSEKSSILFGIVHIVEDIKNKYKCIKYGRARGDFRNILLWRAASLRSAPQPTHIKTSLFLVRCRR